ncbi:MAG: PAS-domain containing protein [Rhodobacteraceae bacterium]|nr:PAS-domain containing protein [Paracoccaceae bacterium]
MTSSVLALTLIMRWSERRAGAALQPNPHGPESQVFIFDGDALDDTSDAADVWLSENEVEPSDELRRLTQFLTGRFPGLPRETALTDIEILKDLPSADGRTALNIRRLGERTRLELNPLISSIDAKIDVSSLRALENELETHRANSEHLPYLVWRETPQGEVTWINRAYFDLVEKSLGPEDARKWPAINLFETRGFLGQGQESATGRLPVRAGGEKDSWYDCAATRVHNEIMFSAANASQIVRAETQLREFTQTLAKTFSHLTVGLAIFDRGRRLRLFNPALSDLTGLSAQFLTARPTLVGFLDELRDAQMIPEPKDYSNWRTQLTEMEAEASNGTYQETWSLPSGQTYRVSGRPHPDGSLAFLFEDISSEISLTRRFRAELELSQAVVDALPDAVAVFTRSGMLTLTNTAFTELWGKDPSATMDAPNVNDVTKIWYESTHPTPAWGDFREFCLTPNGRAEWSADVQLTDGRSLTCRFGPLPGGATIALFATAPVPTQQPSKEIARATA